MDDNQAVTNELIEKTVSTRRQYCVFFYKAGPNRSLPPDEENKLQKEHLRYLLGLKKQGKLLLNGPIMDDPMLKGMGIIDVADKEEARALLDGDPKVRFGWLVYEIHEWFGIPGDGLPSREVLR